MKKTPVPGSLFSLLRSCSRSGFVFTVPTPTNPNPNLNLNTNLNMNLNTTGEARG
jgi:hypothetical protein